MNTGQLRAKLQPVRFAIAIRTFEGVEAGEIVGLQYWGNGNVVVTPGNGLNAFPMKAHDLAPHIEFTGNLGHYALSYDPATTPPPF